MPCSTLMLHLVPKTDYLVIYLLQFVTPLLCTNLQFFLHYNNDYTSNVVYWLSSNLECPKIMKDTVYCNFFKA